MQTAKVSSKGQIVIPKKVREQLHLKPGAFVLLEVVDDHLELIPLPEDPVEHLCGVFKDYTGSLADELLKERKHEREQEEDRSL